MSVLELMKVEWKKTKRSKIFLLLLIPPILVAGSGVASLARYLMPEYENAWKAMFIQSALLFGYYLLPFSMAVVCAMMASRENQNNGILRMLALPVKREKMAAAKFLVLLLFLAAELAFFFGAFVAAGIAAAGYMGVREEIPVLYLLSWTGILFVSMLPCTACMWAVTVFFEKPLLSVGLNLFLIIPGILAANTPFWLVYPYCYSGYLVTRAMGMLTDSKGGGTPLFPVVATVLGAAALLAAAKSFGRKEMR